MKRGVFVLGMHRSGTSAATRLVNLLGVPTCTEDDLLPPTPDNPRGYWESASLTAFNDRLLATLGCDWSCPVRPPTGWDAGPSLQALRAEAAELFRTVFPTDQWVWKDPRTSITFSFWARCVEARPVVVVVYRNPLEVAASLGVRDLFGKAHSLALWERYVRRCFQASAGLPTLVTAYAELLADPVGWCTLARKFLRGSGVATSGSWEAGALDFVDRGLQSFRFANEDLDADPAVSTEQRRLFAVLESVRGAHAGFAVPALPPETASTELLLAHRRQAIWHRLSLQD